MMWLLKTETFNKMHSMIKAGSNPDHSQVEAYVSEHNIECSDGTLPRISRIVSEGSNVVGQINIHGVLTKKPDLFAMLFGGGNATYADIENSLAALDKDDSVSEILLNIDSPGGNVDGMFSAMYAIRDTKKPVKAVVSGLCASAAYGLASQANSITAKDAGCFVGSIGTAATFYTDDNVVTVTSTNAPKKRPNVATEEGFKAVQEELDAIHELFVEAISQGRKTSIDNVNFSYGQGGTFLAGDALKRGMIDGLSSNDNLNRASAKNNSNNRVKSMDLKTLKLDHAELYDQVKKEAVAGERDRVEAHLTMGEASGDMNTAIEAIKSGSDMTQSLQAKYMMAGMNKRDVEARKSDESDVDAIDTLSDSSNETGDASSESDKVASIVLKRMYGV